VHAERADVLDLSLAGPVRAAGRGELTLTLGFSVDQLNWLDWIVVALLVLSALDGTRRGLLLGTLDLAAAAVGVVVAMVAERPVGDEIAARVPALPAAVVHLGVFLAVLILVQMIIGATLGRLVLGMSRGIARGPLGCVDRLLGLAPGLARGVIIVTLFLLPFALLPLLPAVSQGIEQSALANRLVAGALQLMPPVEARLGQDLQGGLPGLVVAPPEADSETTRPLPAGPPVGNLAPDADAEQRMLGLLNDERARAGLRPLVADDRLREVARQHSLEMFQRDYFSHTSPTGGSPFDRMHAAGIAFLVAGENLAFAPNVDIAHRGLMNSPGHRANILRPEFGKVGIGVIRSPAQGSMFTQEFTN
jgi:uncharacterized protein YkwD/uncharacterized membrane protein required for colicin V production